MQNKAAKTKLASSILRCQVPQPRPSCRCGGTNSTLGPLPGNAPQAVKAHRYRREARQSYSLLFLSFHQTHSFHTVYIKVCYPLSRSEWVTAGKQYVTCHWEQVWLLETPSFLRAKLGERAKLSHEQIQGVRKMNQWSSCQLGVTLRALHRKSFSSGKVMTVLTILFLNGPLEMRRKKCADSTFIRKVCKSRKGG